MKIKQIIYTVIFVFFGCSNVLFGMQEMDFLYSNKLSPMQSYDDAMHNDQDASVDEQFDDVLVKSDACAFDQITTVTAQPSLPTVSDEHGDNKPITIYLVRQFLKHHLLSKSRTSRKKERQKEIVAADEAIPAPLSDEKPSHFLSLSQKLLPQHISQPCYNAQMMHPSLPQAAPSVAYGQQVMPYQSQPMPMPYQMPMPVQQPMMPVHQSAQIAAMAMQLQASAMAMQAQASALMMQAQQQMVPCQPAPSYMPPAGVPSYGYGQQIEQVIKKDLTKQEKINHLMGYLQQLSGAGGNEMQRLLLLLDLECDIIEHLLAGNMGQIIDQVVYKRSGVLKESSSLVIAAYDLIIDLATTSNAGGSDTHLYHYFIKRGKRAKSSMIPNKKKFLMEMMYILEHYNQMIENMQRAFSCAR